MTTLPADTKLLKALWAHGSKNYPDFRRAYLTSNGVLFTYSATKKSVMSVKLDKATMSMVQEALPLQFQLCVLHGEMVFGYPREVDIEIVKPFLRKVLERQEMRRIHCNPSKLNQRELVHALDGQVSSARLVPCTTTKHYTEAFWCNGYYWLHGSQSDLFLLRS